MAEYVRITTDEIERLQGIERAWVACFEALRKGNTYAFQAPGTGAQCAVREIERLQVIAGIIQPPITKEDRL